MQFIDVDARTLHAARPGLELAEEVLDDSTIYLYGLTSKQTVLLAAQDALTESEEDGFNEHMTEVAVALYLGKGALSLLFGSGMVLNDQAFSYVSGADGARTSYFTVADSHRGKPKVVIKDLTRMALADSDIWLDEFRQQYGKPAYYETTVDRGATPAVKASSKKHTVNSIDAFLNI